MSYKTIIFHVEQGIATLTLNRPAELNTFNESMRREARQVIDQLFYNEDIRAVIITGAGRAFSAGGDIKSFDENLLTPVYRAQVRELTRMYDDLEALEKPVIAAINGPATGAGIGLALACDVRFAASDATLGFREHFIGLISAAGGCSRLVRLTGLGKAKEIMFTGDMLTAEEAAAIGLVNRVVAAGELMATARDFALKIIRRAPQAIGLLKRVLNAATSIDQTTSIMLESLAQSILVKTEDHREGVKAFLEKRKANFNGR